MTSAPTLGRTMMDYVEAIRDQCGVECLMRSMLSSYVVRVPSHRWGVLVTPCGTTSYKAASLVEGGVWHSLNCRSDLEDWLVVQYATLLVRVTDSKGN